MYSTQSGEQGPLLGTIHPQLTPGVIPPSSSIELTRGARGAYSWSIKMYHADLQQALVEIEDLDQQLRNRYLR